MRVMVRYTLEIRCMFTHSCNLCHKALKNFTVLIYLADLLLPCDHYILMSVTVP